MGTSPHQPAPETLVNPPSRTTFYPLIRTWETPGLCPSTRYPLGGPRPATCRLVPPPGLVPSWPCRCPVPRRQFVGMGRHKALERTEATVPSPQLRPNPCALHHGDRHRPAPRT